MARKSLTRHDLAKTLVKNVGLSYRDSSEMVSALFEELSTALENTGKAKISSFGTFSVHYKNPRIGRNLHTREEVMITGRNVLTFRPSAKLKNRVNSGPGDGSEDDA